MMRRNRIILLSVACILFLLAAKTVVEFVRYSKVERGFVSVRVGESRAVVVSKIGSPNYQAGRCGIIHSPGHDCALEYVYSHPLAPINPEYHIVSFSADDRVIEAKQWDSP
jgi:hypothetical protein